MISKHIRNYNRSVEEFIRVPKGIPEPQTSITQLKELGREYLPFSKEEAQIIEVFKNKRTNEIQQRFWEMYLYNFLLSNEYTITKETKGPDFICNDTMYIEAICPIQNYKIKEFYKINGKAKSVPDEEFNLKITSAIKEKSDKFIKYKKENSIKDGINIIAINTSNLGNCSIDTKYGISQCPRPLEICFGIGPIQLTINKSTNTTENVKLSYSPRITKDNGTDISSEIFLNNNYNHISGIIFSNVRYYASTQEEIDFVHNPNALHKLEHKSFDFSNEYVLENN